MSQNAPRAEIEGVVAVRLFARPLIVGDMKTGTSVGSGEAVGEEARSTRVIRCRAGPENTLLGIDLFVGNASVVGQAPGAGAPEFFEDLPGVPKAEILVFAQAPGQLAEQRDLIPDASWRVKGTAPMDDA